MEIIIDYLTYNGTACIKNHDVPDDIWDSLIRKLTLLYPESDIRFSYDVLELPWRYYLRIKDDVIASLCYWKNISISLTDSVINQLNKQNNEGYEYALSVSNVPIDDIENKLKDVGFERKLTANQLLNLSKIIKMPGAATFSVPGAGKTTEALAYFFYNKMEGDKLIVVAPKNALISWDDELNACVPNCKNHFIRLQGGEENIAKQLLSNPSFMIITYDSILSAKKVIYNFLLKNSVFMFLDESHKIKAGEKGKKGRVILDLSYIPTRRLVMSGTPMPQSTEDLVPQFRFLYPEKKVNQDTVVDLFQPIYVRTTADKLGIPSIKYIVHPVEMSEIQRKVYERLKSAEKRELETYNISDCSKENLKRLGKSIMKILQFVSNPALLTLDMAYTFSPEFANILVENDGPKLKETISLVRDLTVSEKVVVWTTFKQNIQVLTNRLADLGATFIDGTVPTGDKTDPATREYRINQFKNNPDCKVLIANPAACSESISLHMVCHNAIYMDRSFNVAHFLQSEDRIHRLGLKESPIVHIIECNDSVDQLVNNRLNEKIKNMSDALNDPSIIINEYEIDDVDDEEIETEEERVDTDIDSSDYNEIINFFFGS